MIIIGTATYSSTPTHFAQRRAALRIPLTVIVPGSMTPRHLYLLLLFAATFSATPWAQHLPDILFLILTLCGVVAALLGPGLAAVILLRRRTQARSIHLLWIATAGPVTMAIIGLIAWSVDGDVGPRVACQAGFLFTVLVCLTMAMPATQDLRLTQPERKLLVLVCVVVLVAAGRSVHSLGVHGELYEGTITRTFGADGRSDPRVPFLIPINVANHWNPFGPDSQNFYSPYTFASRGPLVGLATTPAALVWGLSSMRTIAQMNEPFHPVDRYGYMQYRFAIIITGALALIPLFVALGADEQSVAGTALYALSPFLIHELYFTWTKQAIVPFVLSAFCLVLARRPGLAGVCIGLAYLTHPSAAFAALAFVPLLIISAEESDWRRLRAGTAFAPSAWWRARSSLLSSLSV